MTKRLLIFSFIVFSLSIVLISSVKAEENDQGTANLDAFAHINCSELQKNHFEALQKKWRSYMEAWSQLSGRYLYSCALNDAPKDDFHIDFVSSYPSFVSSFVGETTQSELVNSISDDYLFRLVRNDESGNQLKIEELKPSVKQVDISKWRFPGFDPSKNPNSELIERQENEQVGYNIYTSLGYWLSATNFASLPQLLLNDMTEIITFELDEYNEKKALRLAFVYRYPTPSSEELSDNQGKETILPSTKYYIKGNVWLEPDSFLVIHADYEEESIGNMKERSVRDYAYTTFNDFPVPQEYSITWDTETTGNQPVCGQYYYRFSEFAVPSAEDKNKFKLSYYGIPEPKKDSRFDITRWLFMTVGGLLIIMSIWQFRKRRQTN